MDKEGGMGQTPKYDEEFRKSLVMLHNYATVKMDDGEAMTARQVKDLKKRNAALEKENLILKKAIAIFVPHSEDD